MQKLYSTGEFAKKAGVTLRTIRYYDKINLLKPTTILNNGYRRYCAADLIKLQKIITLKELGFSLEEIAPLIQDNRADNLIDSLDSQIQIVNQKIKHLINLKESLKSTKRIIKNNNLAWDKITELIKLSVTDDHLVSAYLTTNYITNLNRLKQHCSSNSLDFASWLYNQINFSQIYRLFDVNAYDHQLWAHNTYNLRNREIFLGNNSRDILDELRKRLGNDFNYIITDNSHLPFKNNYFDSLIVDNLIHPCNHNFKELKRIVRSGGTIYWLTYNNDHFKELEDLLSAFNPELKLNIKNTDKMPPILHQSPKLSYRDPLVIKKPKYLINYLLSCNIDHKELLSQQLPDFYQYLKNLIQEKETITINQILDLYIYHK